MSQMARTVIELLALAIGLVGGYLYLEELGRLWLFWLLAGCIAVTVVGWHGRRRIRKLVRRFTR